MEQKKFLFTLQSQFPRAYQDFLGKAKSSIFGSLRVCLRHLGGREGVCIMERMMVEEMKWQRFHLETETLLCSPWMACVSVSGTPLQLKHEVTWRKRKV